MSEQDAQALLHAFMANLDAERLKAGLPQRSFQSVLGLSAGAVSNLFNSGQGGSGNKNPPQWGVVERVLRHCWSRHDHGVGVMSPADAAARARLLSDLLVQHLADWKNKYSRLLEEMERAREPGSWPVYRRSYGLEEFARPPRPAPRNLPPSRLLAASSRVVEFTGREAWLMRLEDWRDDVALAGALLVFGPGGQGKTRLGEKFATDSAEAGWTVLSAHQLLSTEHLTTSAAPPPIKKRLLVIVDYADRWIVEDLHALFTDPLLRDTGAKLRVLLLARSSPWWEQVRLSLPGIEHAATLKLDALTSPGEERRLAFRTATRCFAEAFDDVDVDEIPDRNDLDDDKFGIALTIHMAALVAVDAAAKTREQPTEPRLLSGYLMLREQEHWAKMRGKGQILTRHHVMARAVLVATLTQGTTHREGHRLLAELKVSPDPEQVLADHATCYPSVDGDLALVPLGPDRFGEDYIALRIGGHGFAEYSPDPWASGVDGAVATLLTGERMQSPWLRRAMTVLIDAAALWPHLQDQVLFPLLRKQPDLALAAGSYGLSVVTELLKDDVEALELIERQLPPWRQIDLDGGSAELTRVLTDDRLDRADDDAARAQLRLTLGVRLGNAGRLSEAIAAIEKAVVDIKQWGRQHKVAREPELLAASLAALGKLHAEAGHGRQALEKTGGAVEIYRKLSARRSPSCLAGLAQSLVNHSVLLLDDGQLSLANDEATQARDILEGLLSARPELKPHFAAAVDNLGVIKARLHLTEDAYAHATAATRLFADLAESDPSAYEVDYAGACGNFSDVLRALGRTVEAVKANARAVAILARLGKDSPAFDPHLVRALTRQVNLLLALPRPREAAREALEAVKVARRLAQAGEGRFDDLLAQALFWRAEACLAAEAELADGVVAAESSAALYNNSNAQDAEVWAEKAQVTARRLRVRLANL